MVEMVGTGGVEPLVIVLALLEKAHPEIRVERNRTSPRLRRAASFPEIP
jgi:hypothetical protein